ncbi:MAG: hypothetical protein P1U57_13800 [Oleibacter sp.]|nr:hypothetical protein [Thalassolituus sp.]
MLNIDMTVLFLGVVFSSLGLGYFIYGKKQELPVVKYAGVVLMVYPYFVTDKVLLIVIGLGLMALPRFLKM